MAQFFQVSLKTVSTTYLKPLTAMFYTEYD